MFVFLCYIIIVIVMQRARAPFYIILFSFVRRIMSVRLRYLSALSPPHKNVWKPARRRRHYLCESDVIAAASVRVRVTAREDHTWRSPGTHSLRRRRAYIYYYYYESAEKQFFKMLLSPSSALPLTAVVYDTTASVRIL